MKKCPGWSLLLMAALFIVTAPVALAYGSVTGQVNDANGNAWTHGGAVTCVTMTGANLGSGVINPNGSWSVTFSQRRAATCTIDPAAASGGDPAAFTCSVPLSSSTGNFDCGARALNAGPNAVALVSLSGQSLNPAWLLAPVGLVAGLLAWLHRR